MGGGRIQGLAVKGGGGGGGGQALDKAMFQQLRTEERLGYIVSAGAVRKWGVCGLRCVVQSAARPPAAVEARVDACLRAFGAGLAALPEAEVAARAESLRTQRLERDRTAAALCERVMGEVCAHEFVFDRREREAAELGRLRRADLVEFFERHLAPDGADRRGAAARSGPGRGRAGGGGGDDFEQSGRR